MNNRKITPDIARAELQRRQAARDELKRRKMSENGSSEILKIPGYALGAALSLPEKFWESAKQVPGALNEIISHPIDAARDVAGGVARGSQNLASALLEGGEYATRKGAETIGKLRGQDVYVEPWNARQFMGLAGNNKIDLGKYLETDNPNKLLSGLGQYGLGGAAGGIRSTPFIAANTINSAIQAQPGERIRAATEGLVNTALPTGIGKGINNLRPSNLLSGNLSPDQLQQNLQIAKDTTTRLGDVVGSPNLKRFYNFLPRVPFSGADEVMQDTANQLINKGQQHLARLGKDLPEGDKTEYLQDALKKASKEATIEKNENFSHVNDLAEQSGLFIPRNNFRKKANDVLAEINQSPELKREFSKGLMKDIKSYAGNSKGNTLRLSNIFKGKLNDKANELYINGKKHEYSILKDLKDALGNDIETAISSSKNPELKNAYEKAMKDYGSKYKPFEDRDIVKFTREGGDPDLLLSHFLKTGPNDRSTLLSKVQNKLPTELQYLPAYMYLSKASEEGNLNPLKLRTLYKNLGEKQRKTLIPDAEIRKEIDKYTKSVTMNTEAFKNMYNPRTEQKLSDIIPAVGAMIGYKVLGGGIPGIAGLLLGATLPGIAGKGAVSMLTSPGVRENLVNAIINKKLKQKKD